MRRTFLHLNPWFVADQTGSAVGVDMLRLMKKVAGWFIGLLIDWFSDSFNAWAEKIYYWQRTKHDVGLNLAGAVGPVTAKPVRGSP